MPQHSMRFSGIRGLPDNTILANNSGGVGPALALTPSQIGAMGIYDQDLNTTDDVEFSSIRLGDVVMQEDTSGTLSIENGATQQQIRLFQDNTNPISQASLVDMDWDTESFRIRTVSVGSGQIHNLQLAPEGGVVWTPITVENHLYNVGDPTVVDYERGFSRWTSNVLEIGPEAGGSGTVRNVRLTRRSLEWLELANSQVSIEANGGTTRFTPTSVYGVSDETLGEDSATRRWPQGFFGGSSVTTSTPIFDGTQTNTASSGVIIGTQFLPTHNQTGTAGSTDFLINRTETALGSGVHRFLDFQVAGTSHLTVSRLGAIFVDIGSSNDVPLEVRKSGTGATAIFRDESGDAYIEFQGSNVCQFLGSNTTPQVQASVNMGAGGAKAGWIALSADSGDENQLVIDPVTNYTMLQQAATWASTWLTPTAQLTINDPSGLNIFNTGSDDTDFEHGIMDWSTTADVLTIGAIAGGLGTERGVAFVGANFDFSDGSYVFSSEFRLTSDGDIKIDVSASRLLLTSRDGHSFRFEDSNTSTDVFEFIGNTGDQLTAASGVQNFISATPDINQSGTAGYTGILLDVTETALGSGAHNLLDLQIASTTIVAVDSEGMVVVPVGDGSGNGGGIALRGDRTDVKIISRSVSAITFAAGANESIEFGGIGGEGAISVRDGGSFGWASSNNPASTDTFMYRDGARIVAIRDDTDPCALKVYNTDDGTQTDFERGVMDWQTTADVLTIGAVAGGLGTERPVDFVGDSFNFTDGSHVETSEYRISNDTEGNTGNLALTTSHETHTLANASTSDTTTISVPDGARLKAVSMNVNTAVVDDGGDDTWSAAFVTGSTTTIVTGEAAAQDTKTDVNLPDEITSGGVSQIRFTANGGNFTAGVIEVVCYYEELTSLANV